ncbi:MAG: heme-binding protein [Methylophilus sp.]|nr:heme-binding protein [Methylophilus sp.]
MTKTQRITLAVLSTLAISAFSMSAQAGLFGNSGGGSPSPAPAGACAGLPTYTQLKAALISASTTDASGFNLNMWGTVVNRDGVVCAVAFTGTARGDQWPGSRVISAQKANTANAFSLPGLALSTANLYSAVQGTEAANNNLGGSLYGLQFSNPVDTDAAYSGNQALVGSANDPMVGKRIGGVNVFGGGLALYNSAGTIIGAIGLSGDTSCADHNQAWLTRKNLNLDYVPAGVSGDATRPDNMVIDSFNGDNNSKTDGWEQPTCANPTDPALLPVVRTVAP